MKEIIVSAIISLLLNFTLNAQIAYKEGNYEAMTLWKNLETVEAANTFECIEKVEQDQWGPSSTSAFCSCRSDEPIAPSRGEARAKMLIKTNCKD